MSNPIDDYTPEEYLAAIDDYLHNYEPPLTVSVHPTPQSFVSAPLEMNIDNPALYDRLCARRAPWYQSALITLGHLLYAYWQRGQRR